MTECLWLECGLCGENVPDYDGDRLGDPGPLHEPGCPQWREAYRTFSAPEPVQATREPDGGSEGLYGAENG